MLRHACGFALANDGQDTRAIQEWLGHQNIQHTTRYTELTAHAVQGVLAGGGLNLRRGPPHPARGFDRYPAPEAQR